MLQENKRNDNGKLRPKTAFAAHETSVGRNRHATDHRQPAQEAGREDHLQANPQDESGVAQGESELGFGFRN